MTAYGTVGKTRPPCIASGVWLGLCLWSCRYACLCDTRQAILLICRAFGKTDFAIKEWGTATLKCWHSPQFFHHVPDATKVLIKDLKDPESEFPHCLEGFQSERWLGIFCRRPLSFCS